MSLSPSFSDFPSPSGSHSSFMPVSDTAHSRSTASSMGLIPVIPEADAASQSEPTSKATADRRSAATASRAGRAGMERRQFGSSHAGLSDQGRELAAAIDAYKLEHHRRYITCDEMLVVLGALGYAQNTDAQNS